MSNNFLISRIVASIYNSLFQESVLKSYQYYVMNWSTFDGIVEFLSQVSAGDDFDLQIEFDVIIKIVQRLLRLIANRGGNAENKYSRLFSGPQYLNFLKITFKILQILENGYSKKKIFEYSLRIMSNFFTESPQTCFDIKSTFSSQIFAHLIIILTDFLSSYNILEYVDKEFVKNILNCLDYLLNGFFKYEIMNLLIYSNYKCIIPILENLNSSDKQNFDLNQNIMLSINISLLRAKNNQSMYNDPEDREIADNTIKFLERFEEYGENKMIFSLND